MLLFIDEARSRSLLMSIFPLSSPVDLVKSSKKPLFDSVELMLNRRTIAAFFPLQAKDYFFKSKWNN
jgi:hypothetical protein